VLFDGRPVVYSYADLDELSSANACSIHKSQGSEYAAVVIPLHTQHYALLQRNLLYTGSRAGDGSSSSSAAARPRRSRAQQPGPRAAHAAG